MTILWELLLISGRSRAIIGIKDSKTAPNVWCGYINFMRTAPSVNVPELKTTVYDTADITTNKRSSVNICLFVFTIFCENETQTLNKIRGRFYLVFAKTTRDNAHKTY